jgi:GGDEF domain-containing protein
MELRDHYTKGHSEHVANLLKLIHSHLPKKQKAMYSPDVFEPVGLLHDIGKLGVPEIILNKSGKLNDKEWEFMKKHPTFGSNLLKTADDYEGFSDWIEFHHERIDGRGYLELSADDIPYISKLLAVADTYSALVTNRPYRPGKNHDEAIEIITSVKGKQLDATIVEIFCGIDRDEVEACKPENLGFEAIDEIEKDIETYFKERQLRKIINMANSEAYINKLVDMAEQEQTIFSVCRMQVGGSKEGTDINDYHDADELTEKIGQTLIDSTRPTDLIFRIRRNSFLLIFPNNPRESAEKLVERVEEKINTLEVVKSNSLKISVNKRFAHFDPKVTTSFNQVRDFIQSEH